MGVWGHAPLPPQENFCKIGLLRLNLEVILSEKHDVTLFIIPLQFVNIAKRHSQ